jgi:hypothetical protein
MLRAVGWAVLLVVGIAAPASANHSGHGAAGSATAVQQGAGDLGNGTFVAGRTTPVEVTHEWAGAQLSGGPMAGPRREAVNQPAMPPMLAPKRAGGGSSVLPWVSPEKPALDLPVNDRLSVAVGYQHVEGEDRWRPYGEAGPIDYDSHDFLLGVAWRF